MQLQNGSIKFYYGTNYFGSIAADASSIVLSAEGNFKLAVSKILMNGTIVLNSSSYGSSKPPSSASVGQLYFQLSS